MKAEEKLRWKPMILAVLVTASLELIWILHNTYTPIWLQAGNSIFDAGNSSTIPGFGFGAFGTGLILTLGNIFALLLSPLAGVLSDATRSRWGRRKPWIIYSAPIAIISLALLPVVANQVPPELSGQTSELTSILVLFLLILFLMLIPVAIMRSPATVLVYDITPSKYRSVAASLSGFAGGFASITGAVVGALLFDIYPPLPFWVAAFCVGAAITLAAIFIQEPEIKSSPSEVKAEKQGLQAIIQMLRSLPQEHARSLFFLVLSMFLTFISFGQMQSFISSYSVTVLGIAPGNATLLYAVGGGAFLLFAFPASYISTKLISRKNTQIVGILIYVLVCLLIYFVANATWIWILVAISGAAWALVSINQEPMMMDSAPSDSLLGTYTGVLQVARYLGFAVAPILGGWIVQSFGNDYNNMWLVMGSAQFLALLALLPVTTGEAK